MSCFFGMTTSYRRLSGEKTPLFAPFIYKMHYFTKEARDKHRENSKKERFLACCRRSLVGSLWRRGACGTASCLGKETVTVFAPILYRNDHFAKTGSGQTWGKSTQKTLVFPRLLGGENPPGLVIDSLLLVRKKQTRAMFLWQSVVCRDRLRIKGTYI